MKANLIVLFLLISGIIIGQEDKRIIEVMGYAETYVYPDEIYYSVELREYKIGREIVKMKSLEKNFQEVVLKAGIQNEDIEIDQNKSWKVRYKRKQEEVLQQKKYIIKFRSIDKLNEFSKLVEKVPVERAGISRIDHSRLKEIRDDLAV